MRFSLSLPALFAAATTWSANPATSQAAPVRTITPKFTPNTRVPALGFSLWLPARFTKSQTRQQAAGQSQSATVYEFQTDARPILYSLRVADHPPSERGIGAKLQLDLKASLWLQPPRTVLVRTQSLRLSTFPGRELQLRARGGAQLVRARIFTTPLRTYEISARATPAEMQKMSAQIDRVLDSLRILPQ